MIELDAMDCPICFERVESNADWIEHEIDHEAATLRELSDHYARYGRIDAERVA